MQAEIDGDTADVRGTGPRESEFRRGWPILLAALLGIGCGLAAMPFYTAGVFAPHLAREFGWSLGEIMAGLTITTVTVVVAAPVTGMLCDRYGTRPIAIASLACFGLAYLSLAALGNSLVQFYATWAVAAALGAGTLPITFTRTVNQWFDRHRGLALGIAMTGTGLFGIVCKPLLAWVIGLHGWRAGYFALGLLPLLVALPMVVLLFREQKAAAPALTAVEDGNVEALTGLSRKQALGHWRFWLIAIILFPISFALAGAVPNLEPILLDRGLDAQTILTITPLIGLASIAGRLIGGLLLDRFWAPAVAFILLGMPAISCVILAGGTLDPGMARFAILLIGFALGIEYDVVAYLTSRFFGMRAYSAIYSIFYVCFATGAGFAPLVFGVIRDRTQDFAPALLASAVILPLCSAAFLFLGRYPRLTEAGNAD
ncbi:MFS transporter [Rhizorhabdus phycosphaerae]|uniref:MFS transporter n=1 Tax=Rhizorhabdus phycosphaerae TaxID=2711156 RepID=UPI0013EA1784|nr:MFS transporter [Rhizorhabdus phycosphaerae]